LQGRLLTIAKTEMGLFVDAVAVDKDLDDEVEIRNGIVEILVAISGAEPTKGQLKRARESVMEAARILKGSK
jgi:hypothetical protein